MVFSPSEEDAQSINPVVNYRVKGRSGRVVFVREGIHGKAARITGTGVLSA